MVMVFKIKLRTKELNRLVEAVNILISPDLFLVAGLEAELLERRRGAILGKNYITYLVNTITLIDL